MLRVASGPTIEGPEDRLSAYCAEEYPNHDAIADADLFRAGYDRAVTIRR